MAVKMELTLGPIPFHWSAEARRDFYARIADEAPVDTVYLTGWKRRASASSFPRLPRSC